MAVETRVLLVKKGETLIIATTEMPDMGQRALGTIGAWFEQMCGISVLFIQGDAEISKPKYEPCRRGNQMGECVLQEGHEKIGPQVPGAKVGPGPTHIDRTGQSWEVTHG